MIKLKAIRPAPDALSPRKYERAIETALGIVAVTAVQEFQQTTRSWRHKPTFRIAKDGDDRVTVGTDDEVYGYVDQGTRPHVIRPRRGRFLRFQAGARAKTTPGSLSSGGGGGGVTTFRRGVNHPGTKARGFSELIARRAEGRVLDEVTRQLRKAAE
jgi:hypothetical protein